MSWVYRHRFALIAIQAVVVWYLTGEWSPLP